MDSNRIPGEAGSLAWRGFRSPVTEQCAQVLIDAANVARGFGHDYTGTEHLLLAMLRTPGSNAATVLASLTDPAVLARRCDDRLRSMVPPNLGGDPFQTRTRQLEAVIRRAESFAGAVGSPAVGTDHLLHGVADDVSALAYEMLVAGGVSPGRLGEALSGS